MDSGVATRPLADLEAYRQRMARFMYQSGASMEPVFAAAKTAKKQVLFAEGEDDRVLRAAQIIVDEGLARPILVGRPSIIDDESETLGCGFRLVVIVALSALIMMPVTSKHGTNTMSLRGVLASPSRSRARRCGPAQRCSERCFCIAAMSTP